MEQGPGKKRTRRILSSDESETLTTNNRRPVKKTKNSNASEGKRSENNGIKSDESSGEKKKQTRKIRPKKSEVDSEDLPKTRDVTKKSEKRRKKQESVDEEKISGDKSAKRVKTENSLQDGKSSKTAVSQSEELDDPQDEEASDESADSQPKVETKPGGLGNWPEEPADPTSSRKVAEIKFDPGIAKYHEVRNACWKSGAKVPYLALSRTLDVIEKTSARSKMIECLSNFFRSVRVLSPRDLTSCIYLCLNKLGPPHEGLELGVGESLLMKTIASATGRSMEKIKADLRKQGDLGKVAENYRVSERSASTKLTVKAVFKGLKEIARMTGDSVVQKKIDKMASLLVTCRGPEARFLIRSLEGNLRVGLAEKSLLVALAQAVVLALDKTRDKSKRYIDSQAALLKTAFYECPNYDIIVPVLLRDGIAGLKERCMLTPGIPLKPMMAYPAKGVQEVLERFENVRFTCEYKYDGERAQIHFLGSGEIFLFSRNQEDTSGKYPDVIGRMPRALKKRVRSCILDTEIVAWDRRTRKIRPFQVLSTRKKKNVDESQIEVQVCVFAFDLLYLNGRSLVKENFEDRRELLRKNFKAVEGEFMFVEFMDSGDMEEIGEFLEESVKGNCEGLVIKALEANYEIAKRSHNWLKLKKDYLEGVGDTLDLVVIGGYHGKGKRHGLFGGFLLACYGEESDELQTICKLGTGFKEEDLKKLAAFFKLHVIDKPRSYYRYQVEPDVWFKPVQVWEVKCAGLTKSPVHKAAVGLIDHSTNGISLRFPRFLRVRDDKTPEMATTASQVADMYRNQEQPRKNRKRKRRE